MLYDILTKKEYIICVMYSEGLNSSEIAIKLNMTVQTLNKHRAHIKSKLNATTCIQIGFKFAKLRPENINNYAN